MAENNIGYFVGGVGRFKQIQIVGLDKAARQKPVGYPINHPLPEIAADQNNRTGRNLAGLHQRQAFKQFVQRAEAAGHDDVSVGVFDEHHLAREKVAEFQRNILKLVGGLLMRQLDVQPDRQPLFARVRALVRRFHHAGAAAGNHGKPRIRQTFGDVLRLLIDRMLRRDTR